MVKVYAMSFNLRLEGDPPDQDPDIIEVGMDGSVWANWDRVDRAIESLTNSIDPQTRCCLIQIKMIKALRGSWPEVSRERMAEIAAEWGARLFQDLSEDRHEVDRITKH